MNGFLKRYKNILIAAIIIIAAFVAYSLFFTGGEDATLVAEEVDAAEQVVEQELIGLLLELRSIRLNTSLFSDERFQSLKDFSQDVVQEPVGRVNPFAPLGQ